MSRSTHEIERDIERTRSDIEETVEALRAKMSLGQIVDEATHYLRDSGGNEALHNLARQARANPMPLALVGIGLAWLMSGRGQPAMDTWSSTGTSTSAGNGSSLRAMGSRLSETAGSAREAVSGSSRRAGEAVSSRMHQAGDVASQTYGRLSERAGRAQRSMSEVVENEPLILAGLGIALGAAIGAMLPATRTEDRLMGEKLDEMKHDASDMVRKEWEKTKSVAGDAASAARREVEKGGSPSETAERVAKSASQTAEESANRKGLGSSARKS
jgi:hypothetical protein